MYENSGNYNLVRFGTELNTDFYMENEPNSDKPARITIANNKTIVMYESGDKAPSKEVCWSPCGSQARFKQNITDLSMNACVDIIKNLKPKSYQYKTRPAETVTGFIVEDVSGVMNEMITSARSLLRNPKKGEEITYGISLHTLIPTMVSAMQKVMVQNEQLTDRIAQLESIVNKLSS